MFDPCEARDHFRDFDPTRPPDRETTCRIKAHRDWLFGLWIAHRLGREGPNAECYAADLVSIDRGHSDDVYMLDKVKADLRAERVRIVDPELLGQLCRAEVKSRKELLGSSQGQGDE